MLEEPGVGRDERLGGAQRDELVGRDDSSDIAVLTIAGVQLAPARRNDDDARVGQLVLALGMAGNLAATLGVVSASGGPWHRGRGRRHARLISSDAPMFPGFSGGPLIDASGAVLGVLSSHLGRGQTLAIPSGVVTGIVESLKAHGRVRRGYLGVGAQPVDLPQSLRTSHNLEQERGLLLVTVDDDGPAGAAGLIIGDLLLTLAGAPVERLEALRAQLDGDTVGQPIAVRFLRGGNVQEITVTVGEQT